eukprot:c9301_g2_i2.p1 GENE.c9301_g2_i2~~c9301_g2_i2.p1  ORF type:complete len:335 (+),score=93.90 c9301_g2_i2:61-1005(+)
MRKCVLVLFLFLMCEPWVCGASGMRDSRLSNIQQQPTCFAQMRNAVNNFWNSKNSNRDLNSNEMQEIELKCQVMPLRLSKAHPTVLEAVRNIPVLGGLITHLESNPRTKLDYIRANHVIATSSLLQLSDPETTVNAMHSTFLPFWVYGDADSKSDACYMTHFALYVITWIFVGGFLYRFVEGMFGESLTTFDLQVGEGAVVGQLVYAVVLLTCRSFAGYDVRFGQSTCGVKQRTVVNLGLAPLLAFLLLAVWGRVATAKNLQKKVPKISGTHVAVSTEKPGGLGEILQMMMSNKMAMPCLSAVAASVIAFAAIC